MQLHQKFTEIAKESGDKLALVDRTTGQRLSYKKALITALLFSSRFKKEKSKHIGIMLPTSAGAALTTTALLMSGKIPVMINFTMGVEKSCKLAQEKCNFSTIITSSTFLRQIGAGKGEGMVFIEEIAEKFTTFQKIKETRRANLPLSKLFKTIEIGELDDTAVVLFTSGSEKEPKGVELTHRNIISNIEGFSSYLNITSSDRLLATLVFFHVFGFTVNLWLSLYLGMTMVTYARALDFATIVEIARQERVTIMIGTPSFHWGYLNRSKPGDFDSVRFMITGAEKCPDALREGFLKQHNVPLLEGYGATETSPVVSVNSVDENRPGSIGKPLPGVSVKIVNVDSEEECQVGEVGLIFVKGDLVMKGYLGEPEETAKVIKDGWYNTGDMGYLDKDGYLWHSGRYRRFAKVRGEMISLVKVESVLEKYLPEGLSSSVVEIYDENKGSTIVGVVTGGINRGKLLKQMAQDLPNIALPKNFVTIEELPMMGSGKIDFRSLTEIAKKHIQRRG